MGEVRVSAANLVKIELDGKILLCLNKKRLAAGKKVYTPFGGSTEFYPSAKPFLDSLKVEYEKGNDLRLMIDEDKLPEFEKWFYQKKDRETSPYRELKEELVEEEQVLPDLPPDAVDFEYLGTVTERTITDRPGQEGKVTERYLEIYKAKFKPEYEQKIREALEKPDSHLVLVTEREILKGISDSGIEIGGVCKALLIDKK
jgi:predicted nuclease of restriction endonuclease-like RecB superfamily